MSIATHEIIFPKLWVDDFQLLKPSGLVEREFIAESQIREYHSLAGCYISGIANEESVYSELFNIILIRYLALNEMESQ